MNLKNPDLNKLPRLAIFGAGGLGIEMVALLQKRKAAKLVGILDKNAYSFNSNGIDLDLTYKSLSKYKDVNLLENACSTEDSIKDFMQKHAKDIDAIFFALPNLPNEFIPNITKYIINETQYDGVIVDALKRTTAVKMLNELDSQLKNTNILYLTGCGCTPGMLTSAVSLAAQSFVEIKSVKITFGVGIANWQAYRATIREDIAHLKDYNVEKAFKMTEEEIDTLLEQRKGLLELENIEHADDIMLELAGVCSADKVSVGGIVDTRNPKKPISTNVEICGITYQNKESKHVFTLGDETTMAANVNGNVLGFMNAAIVLHNEYGVKGLMTAAEVMPRFAPVNIKCLTKV